MGEVDWFRIIFRFFYHNCQDMFDCDFSVFLINKVNVLVSILWIILYKNEPIAIGKFIHI